MAKSFEAVAVARDRDPSENAIIGRFILSLRELCSSAAIEFAVRVGQLVIDTFYEGNWSLWRTRTKGTASLRRLAGRQDLPVSLPQLYRCVAISEVCHRLPDFSTWRNLGASHIRAVIGLEPEAQERLLSAADQQHWTVQYLESEVHKANGRVQSRRGRPPQSERSRRISTIKRWLEDCPESLSRFEVGSMDAQTRNALHARVVDVSKRCKELELLLRLQVADHHVSTSPLVSVK